MFHGVITALVTPFRDGGLDEERFREHIERQIEAGVDAIVPAGTTGEAATLSHAEHKRLIRIAVEQARGRVPVIAGTGSNNTAEAIELTQAAKDAGADAALLIAPYYNKPTQEGLYRHYRAVAGAVALPLLLYNVPSRTASDLLPGTVARLARVPNIVGLKDATADMARLVEMADAVGGDFVFLSGDDGTVLPFVACGGRGVISVVSNVAPRAMKALVDAARAGELAAARRWQGRLMPLVRALFVRANPMPVKAACAMLGWMEPEVRLPLVPLDDEAEALLRRTLAALDGELPDTLAPTR